MNLFISSLFIIVCEVVHMLLTHLFIIVLAPIIFLELINNIQVVSAPATIYPWQTLTFICNDHILSILRDSIWDRFINIWINLFGMNWIYVRGRELQRIQFLIVFTCFFSQLNLVDIIRNSAWFLRLISILQIIIWNFFLRVLTNFLMILWIVRYLSRIRWLLQPPVSLRVFAPFHLRGGHWALESWCSSAAAGLIT